MTTFTDGPYTYITIDESNCRFTGFVDPMSTITDVNISSSVTDPGTMAIYNVTSIGTSCIPFQNSTVTSVTIPNSVTNIDYGAFNHALALTGITIPTSVVNIDSNAFNSCTNLSTLTFDDINNSKLLKIGSNAFTGDDNYYLKIQNVVIPNSVTSIGDSAFANCTALTSVTLPTNQNFVNISSNCFSGDASLNSINIPDSVTAIYNGAFSNCNNLTSVTIPSSVTLLDTSAFYYCPRLATLTFSPRSAPLAFGAQVFQFCGSLTSVTLPSSLTYAPSGSNAVFAYCNNLTSVTFDSPSAVTSIVSTMFANCTKLTSINIPANVTDIGSEAFSYCTSLTGITIPTSVVNIDSNAFYSCTNLSTLTFDDINNSKLLKIGSNAFTGDYGYYLNIQNVVIPNSVTSIGDSAFASCTALTSVTLPTNQNFVDISSNCFSGDASLNSINIPTNVTDIGSYAFRNCTSLTNITLPSALTIIRYGSFLSSGLKSIRIPSPVTTIEHDVFNGCSNITSVTFEPSSNLTSIGDYAFSGNNATSITLPDTITDIGGRGFSSCNNLTSINMPTALTNLGVYAFSECYKLTSITIFSSVTSIGDSAFENCTALTSVTLPTNPNFAIISSNCFMNDVSLNSINIPNSVTSIGDNAFNSCTNLNNIYFLGAAIPTISSNNSFYGTPSSANIYYINNATGNTDLPTYFLTQTIINLNLISASGGITTSNITGTTADISWNQVYAFTQGTTYSGSLNYYITTIPTTQTYTLTNGTSQNLTGLTKNKTYVVDVAYNINGVALEVANTAFTMACFKSGTKILTDKGYVVIDNLRKGDLVKTLMNGYLPIDSIGKKDIYHIASKERIPAQLYKCRQDKYPGLFEDLVITGCHSILVDNYKDKEEEEKVLKVNNGRRFITDDKQRLPACVDERASVYETPGNYTIYHFALENEDKFFNYGVYANGLLVETCSKRYLNELTDMKLLE